MTRRWISEVPSKMVKIFGLGFSPHVSRVCAGKAAYSSALLGLGRTATAIYGPEMLPAVLPPKD